MYNQMQSKHQALLHQLISPMERERERERVFESSLSFKMFYVDIYVVE